MQPEPKNLKQRHLRLFWKRVGWWWNACTTFLLRFVATAAALLVIALLVRGLTQTSIVIAPISVPKAFEDSGITSTVASQKVRDQIEYVMYGTTSTMRRAQVFLEGEQPTIQVPTVGVSVDDIVDSILTFAHSSRRETYSGEITLLANNAGYRLTLRHNGVMFSAASVRTTPDGVFRAAARAVLEDIQPYLVASWLDDTHDDNAALAEIDTIIEKYPATDQNVIWAHNLRGLIFRDQGRRADAIAEINLALKLNPRFANPHVNLGNIWLDQNNYDKAIEEYETAIKLSKRYATAWANLADVFVQKGDFKAAHDDILTAEACDPQNGAPHLVLGLLYDKEAESATTAHDRNQRRAEAITEYLVAHKLDPFDPRPYYNIGDDYLAEARDEGNPREAAVKRAAAVAEYRAGLTVYPNDPEGYLNLGLVFESEDNVDDAISMYWKAVRYNTRDAYAHLDLSLELVKKGDLTSRKEAAEQLDETCRLLAVEGTNGDTFFASRTSYVEGIIGNNPRCAKLNLN